MAQAERHSFPLNNPISQANPVFFLSCFLCGTCQCVDLKSRVAKTFSPGTVFRHSQVFLWKGLSFFRRDEVQISKNATELQLIIFRFSHYSSARPRLNWMVLSCYIRIFSIYFFMPRFAGGLRLAPSLCSFAGSSNCISCSTNLQHAIFVDIQFLKYGSWQLELPSSISDLNFFYKFWQDRYVFCRFEIQKMFSFWSRQSKSSGFKVFS